jgi:nucleoid-associated protein YejK
MSDTIIKKNEQTERYYLNIRFGKEYRWIWDFLNDKKLRTSRSRNRLILEALSDKFADKNPNKDQR